jgi:hypothetical protein
VRSREQQGFEQNARFRKAWKLYGILQRNGIKAEEAEAINPDQWQMLADAAGVLKPSTTTVSLVIGMLRERDLNAA